jgi:hypothetical protein
LIRSRVEFPASFSKSGAIGGIDFERTLWPFQTIREIGGAANA